MIEPDEVTRALRQAGLGDPVIEAVLSAEREELSRALARARRWRSFKDARTYARSLGLTSRDQWEAFARSEGRPRDLPANPAREYRDEGWRGWADFLAAPRGQLGFAAARVAARKLGLTSGEQWRRLAAAGQLPLDLPRRPDVTYAGRGWSGWPDFLGTRWGFAEARAFARSLGLRSAAEWLAYAAGRRPDLQSRPAGVRASPAGAYRTEGWRGWADFLGADVPSS